MHDQTIEDRLRATLRAEADQLPLTVTTDELERRLVLRERERAGRRIGLLAAGIAAVVLGGATFLAINPFRATQVATTPQPSSAPATPSARPATSVPPSVGPSAVPSGPPTVDPALQYLNPDPEAVDDARMTVPGDPRSTDDTPSQMALDHVRYGAREVGIKLVCIGPQRLTLTWEVGQGKEDKPSSIAAESIACDNTIATFRYDIAARQPLIDDLMLVSATPRTSYRVLVETFGFTNVPIPAGIPPMAMPGGTLLLQKNTLVASANTKTTRVGTLAPRQIYRIAFVCNSVAPHDGESTARWSIGTEGQQDFVDRGEVRCDGIPVGFSVIPGLAPGDADMYVRAGPGTRWYIVVTSPVPASTFLPPALRMWAGSDVSGATSGPALCIGYDGIGDSCGLPVTARDGARVITALDGGQVSLQVDDGWTIKGAKVNVMDRAQVRQDPAGAGDREFAFLNDGSGQLSGSSDRMTLSLAGLDRGEWLLVVSISAEKGAHSFGATYLLPLRVE